MNELKGLITFRIKKLCNLRNPPYELPADSFIDKASEDILNEIFSTWQWINVKDLLPKNGDHILMTDGQQVALGWMNQSRKEFIQVNTWADLTSTVTHWMPLPHPPKEESNNE